MPIHEYVCQSCGHIFEELIRRRSDEEELQCRRCGTAAVTRLMSASTTLGGSCDAASGGL